MPSADNPQLKVKRKPILLNMEKSRVITKYFTFGGEDERINNVLQRVLNLSEERVVSILDKTLNGFSGRHRNLRKALENHYDNIKHYLPSGITLSKERKLLIGAYFTCEYSIESAALFNPSIVAHPDQKNVKKGSIRFIMSFRATGEGHISSIEFKSGVIDKHNDIFFDGISNYVETPVICPNQTIDNRLFTLKIQEMKVGNGFTHYILSQLGEQFTYKELLDMFKRGSGVSGFSSKIKSEAVSVMDWLAKSNYEIKFNPNYDLSERVIFPVLEHESRGIEDARFVAFTDDDGSVVYYAPYTAYNGFNILPQLIKTKDFVTFKISSLNGKAIQNKGMALFPRKVNGKYYMLSRQDGENNHIMSSENIHFWQTSQILQKPSRAWEFVQIGNCGSPIETEAGWLVLMHGVGPMRKYSIGIQLLDLNDPTKIIATLDKPILVTNREERDGYVPNVVYTCGAMIHKGELVLPYGIADSRCGIATVPMKDLMGMLSNC